MADPFAKAVMRLLSGLTGGNREEGENPSLPRNCER